MITAMMGFATTATTATGAAGMRLCFPGHAFLHPVPRPPVLLYFAGNVLSSGGSCAGQFSPASLFGTPCRLADIFFCIFFFQGLSWCFKLTFNGPRVKRAYPHPLTFKLFSCRPAAIALP